MLMPARVLLLTIAVCLSVYRAGGDEPDAADLAHFEKHVRPLLADRCLECHSRDSDSIGGNLLLDSQDGWKVGGDLGPAIVPGSPSESLLIRAVKQTRDDLQMPPDGRLSQAEIGHLERWIRRGAVDPRKASTGETSEKPRLSAADASEHWAFRPLTQVSPDQTEPSEPRWAHSAIDRIISSKHGESGLAPVPRADRRTLIRRATFDLLGVPPTPAEIARFVGDQRPGAYGRLIDRLLASPQYGERWGRHWLDVARYADSNGLDENAAHGNAWRYRDYVIASFNRDLRYDQFVVEQLAGDQLATDVAAVARDRTVATGFLVLGPKVLAEGDEKKMELDIIDEQIETVGRAFMGLTLGCARCHDHKFDPITTNDYYALAGIFASTKTMEQYKRIAKWNETSIATPEQQARHEAQTEAIANAKLRISDLVAEANKDLLAKLAENAKLPKDPETHYDHETRDKLAVLRAELAEAEAALIDLPTAMAVVDRDQPVDQPMLIRGSHLTPAEPVSRGFPRVLVTHRARDAYSIPHDRSGRLELARWLVDRNHPLAARVMVNRIWRWHFGRGIAPTTDNFGLLGDPPSHPELLDWLASQLIADQWSIKRMHRRIMLSETYQLSSRQDETNLQIDPENRLLWRFNVRRLEAEELIDSMHEVSGLLDRRMGGSLLKTENRVLVFNHTSEDHTTYEQPRRAVYLPVIRNHLADVFQLFDYSDASVMTSNRSSTTVAPQALFMMNSDAANRASRHFAERLLRHGEAGQSSDDGELLKDAYRLAFGRPANEREVARGKEYLRVFLDHSQSSTEPRVRAWQLLCQTLLAASEFCYVR